MQRPPDALMPRVFSGLACGNVLVVAATAFLGLLGGAGLQSYHVALAVFALILTCLVQVLAFTYLTVTFKLMGQAIHIGQSSLEPLLQAKQLKKRMTHCLALSISTILVATASGAASWRAGAGVWLHLAAGLALPIVIPYLLYVEHTLVTRNSSLVGSVMRAYAARKAPPGSA